MIAAFGKLGITAAHIERRIGSQVDHILPDQLADLIGIHNSLRDGMTKASDWFDVPAASEPTNNAVQQLNARLTAAPTQNPVQPAISQAGNFQPPPPQYPAGAEGEIL
jgi:hypothetical protein